MVEIIIHGRHEHSLLIIFDDNHSSRLPWPQVRVRSLDANLGSDASAPEVRPSHSPVTWLLSRSSLRTI